MQLLKSDPVAVAADQIAVQVNGQHLEIPAGMNVPQLLDAIGMRSDLVAVEINLMLVPKESHASTVLQPGDAIEVVTVVGGG